MTKGTGINSSTVGSVFPLLFRLRLLAAAASAAIDGIVDVTLILSICRGLSDLSRNVLLLLKSDLQFFSGHLGPLFVSLTKDTGLILTVIPLCVCSASHLMSYAEVLGTTTTIPPFLGYVWTMMVRATNVGHVG